MATVLIVEDNAEIAGLYERIFARHRTHVSDDEPDAIGYLQHDHPDLLILDFHLPSGSGMNILKYVRSQPALKELPVLAVTADDLLRDAATTEGVNVFLTKPFEIRDLVTAAQQLLDAHRSPISASMRSALAEYADAHQKVYNHPPSGQWAGNRVVIDGQICDETWLRTETRRLRSLTAGGGAPRNYLRRLVDKIRGM